MSFNDKGSGQFGDITGKLTKKPQPQNQFASRWTARSSPRPTSTSG